MKTDADTLAVWLWKNERAALIRERGAQGIASRLARELAAYAHVLDSVDSLDSLTQRHALLSGLVERQPLVVLMLRDLFDALGCGCRTYPAPWSSSHKTERRTDCSTWNAARLAHHLHVMAWNYGTFADAIGGDAARCNILDDNLQSYPIVVVEVLERLSDAAADALQRGADGKA